MKMNQNAEYYRGRIEAVDDYVLMTEAPDWKTMCMILGLPVPCKETQKEIDMGIYEGEKK